ncbi:DUF2510 domain-containing protein [Microbacterium sp. Root553]|uniref:DUF2510 domain-containing protein n=1 Tax=Microbacterium sp. Root553 TaxID=1736556 RepID=UPI0009E936BC|nr:DUF2510 domain-containing protein [Microbacterium sp. Root553]
MSMPAGWYDDGSGRQRWWDGARWTEHLAPDGSAAAPSGSAPGSRVAPVLGFVGLGLAVLGTVLACIPVTFVVGVVVLIAAFVVSLVGVFKKNTIVAAALVGPTIPVTSPDTPSSTATEQPSPSASPAPTGERPSPEEIAAGVEALAIEGGTTGYEDQPGFFPCMGQYFYDSELSDESLRAVAAGEDILGAERDLAIDVTTQGALACDP